VIASAVLTSIPLGVSTAVAVAAHEIPQEVGDFAILLSNGYSRTRALWLNVLSGASGVVGAILAFALVDYLPGVLPYCLALAASSFLYVAMSDLIPGLHRGRIDGWAFRQVLLIAAGVITVLSF
jgi:zinc and cadmium transporter